MTSPEIAEEVFDDREVLRARDPGACAAVAGSGARSVRPRG